MALYQLIYTSKRKEICDDREIQNILDSCKRNNSTKDITGILLHSENNFIQYLEGEADTIKELYDLIKKDDRHERAIMISFGPITERVFPSWEMGYKDVSNQGVGFLSDVGSEEKKIFRSMLSGKKQEDNRSINTLVKFFNMAK